MKVKMLVATCWEGKRLKAGDVVDVADEAGKRWTKSSIAEGVPRKDTKEK